MNKKAPSNKKTRQPAKSRTTAKPNASSPTPSPRPGEGRWTFLTNHSHVLIILHRDPSTVLREVAAKVGITERAVQRIIADLQVEGFIEREKAGRRNHYRILADQPLRHPIEAHRTIGDLLQLVDEPN